MLLSRITAMVSDLTATNSTTSKVRILQGFSDLQDFIKLMWDPQQTTGVTRKKIEECLHQNPTLIHTYPTDVIGLLQGLYTRRLSGNHAKYAVISLIRLYPEYTDLILRIADKNLKTRLTHKIINRAFPGLIPDFSVSLGNDKTKAEKYFSQHPTSWYISRKFDGVRCIVRVDGPNTVCFSRNGNKLPAMQDLAYAAGTIFPSGTILDGEVCDVDEKNLECFHTAVSKIKRKSTVFRNFRFYVFDYLTHDEFDTHTSTRVLMDRYSDLASITHTDDRIQIVQQLCYTDDVFATMNRDVATYGWEGLILRRNGLYKGIRSNDILKHKKFITTEYTVDAIETSVMRIIDEATGLEVEAEMLKSVIITHRGETVHVGSGFNHKQRREYYTNPGSIIGRIIEVQYFEECKDSSGKISLRFPTVKQIYSKKRKL
jgi:DNA ligase-1